MKKIIKKILISKLLIDYINFILIKILRLKKILDASYAKTGKFILAKDDDIFVASYPRSGSTWSRLIIANIFFNEVTFNNINDFLPEYYSSNESKFLNKKFRIIKAHDYFDHRFKKVVYIVRDPREVLVSSYYFQINMGSIPANYSKRKFFNEFMKGKFDSNFGSWEENVGSWYGAKSNNIIFTRYEDLIDNPAREIKKICNFLNKRISNTKIKKIINNTSFEKLNRLEKKTPLNWKDVKYNSKGFSFFRAGKKNSWKKFLTKRENEKIKLVWKRYMKIFKYI